MSHEHDFHQVIDPTVVGELGHDKTVGFDLGSRTSKAVLLADGRLHTAIIPTGIYTQQTADKLFARILKQSGYARDQIRYIVGTGYGRIALAFDEIPSKVVTEISCHAMGAHFLNAKVKSIVRAVGYQVGPYLILVFYCKRSGHNDTKRAEGAGKIIERCTYITTAA